jgi:hypothetical protein
MAGLVPPCPGYPRGSAHRMFASAARPRTLCLQNFAADRAPCRPVFEALLAWIAGTGPAMTTRAETNSK